jgi:hypothetical protein
MTTETDLVDITCTDFCKVTVSGCVLIADVPVGTSF